MNIAEFDYQLMPELIAQQPAEHREQSKLMALDRCRGQWRHEKSFAAILDYFQAGDVLVVNDTKVVNARLSGKKPSGGKVEALVIRSSGGQAVAMIQTARRPRPGDEYFFGQYRATVVARENLGWLLDFHGVSVPTIMAEIGLPPLPPYIKRKEAPAQLSAQDRLRYQTVYARQSGAIAAPTAGLHFSEELLGALQQKKVEIVYLTLHVGTATFLPVRVEQVEQHRMAFEYYHISETAAQSVNLALQQQRRVIATGTTSCRALESAGSSGHVIAGDGNTDIFIYPGFTFKIVQALITNFHLPKSTLLLLVAAFAGKDLILEAYRDAMTHQYRFYSYGDAMFIH